MPKQKAKKRAARRNSSLEFDGTYLLKLILYIMIGSFWVKMTTTGGRYIPLPIGFLIGLAFTSKEHFQIDRKIEYAVLLVAMLAGYFIPNYGLYIVF